MKGHVIDASVLATAVLRDIHADAADNVLISGMPLFAPDLIYVEFASAVWKRVGRGDVTAVKAPILLSGVFKLPITITPSADLADNALQLALETRQTVYDCLYLALALRLGTTMVTADQRFVNALSATPLSKYVSLLGSNAMGT